MILFKFDFLQLILTAEILILFQNVHSSITSISKCHYEGDFSVSCKELNELMRTANTINGLHYNDTQCVYNEKESRCHRHTVLGYCVDKPSCSINNDWFSLQPDCEGNSYYTQFNFDCQPAYYMCEDITVVKNAFSGLIYSPSYPYSYRTDTEQLCFLTVNLPRDHHVEITLDFFEIFSSQNCFADFLEILEYKEDLSGIFNSKNKQRRHSTTDGLNEIVSQNKTVNEPLQSSVRLKKWPMAATKQPSIYKWSRVALMCGKEEKKHVIKASTNVINFKFKSLSNNHQYFKQSNKSRTHPGFKIYFQAIPPTNGDYSKNGKNILTTVTQDLSAKISEKNNKEILNENLPDTSNSEYNNKETNKSKQINDSTKLIISITIGVIFLTLVSFLIVFLIFALKRRNSSRNSQPGKKVSKKNGTASKKESSLPAKPNNSKLNLPNTPKIDDSEFSSSTSKSDHQAAHKNSQPATAKLTAKYTPATNATRTFLEPEPRKIQADRPALLQDLNSSKLLLKYKQTVVSDQLSSTKPNETKLAETKPAEAPKLEKEKSKDISISENSNKLNEELNGVYTGEPTDTTKLLVSVNGADKPKLETSKNQLSPSIIKSTDKILDGSKTTNKLPTSDSNSKKNEQASNEFNMQAIKLANEPSQEIEDAFEFSQSSLRIVEETDKKQEDIMSSQLPSTQLPSTQLPSTQLPSTQLPSTQVPTIQTPGSSLPRRTPFNPLQVILTDKNKYYMTEYI